MRSGKSGGILVIAARIPQEIEIKELYPKERNEELLRCRHERVIREKYFAWKLLERAIGLRFGVPISSLELKKNENGKWLTKDFYFSISHSNGVAAVAVSKEKVGVDVESITRRTEGLECRILTPRELETLAYLPVEKRKEYIIEKWTKKESIFKYSDLPCFVPSSIETDDFDVVTKVFEANEQRYSLSVCGDNIKNINWIIEI